MNITNDSQNNLRISYSSDESYSESSTILAEDTQKRKAVHWSDQVGGSLIEVREVDCSYPPERHADHDSSMWLELVSEVSDRWDLTKTQAVFLVLIVMLFVVLMIMLVLAAFSFVVVSTVNLYA